MSLKTGVVDRPRVDRAVTLDEVAQLLRVSRKTVERMRGRGELRVAWVIGRRKFYDADEVVMGLRVAAGTVAAGKTKVPGRGGGSVAVKGKGGNGAFVSC